MKHVNGGVDSSEIPGHKNDQDHLDTNYESNNNEKNTNDLAKSKQDNVKPPTTTNNYPRVSNNF